MHKQLLDANFSIITSLIKEKSRVLDLGCGKGKMLKHLKLEKSCEVQGIDVSQQEVIDCIANAVPVLQLDLEEGMSFTIEPMINAGKRNIKILPDQWTAVTKDHKLSAQWEHTLMVTKDGFEIFTLRQEEQ